MPADHKVVAVIEKEEWSGQHGPMVTYVVALEGVEDPVKVNQKPETPPVTVGMVLFGQTESTAYGLKFKKERRDGAGGGGGFTPERERRIERMAADKVAAHLLDVSARLGLLTAEVCKDAPQLLRAHKHLADGVVENLNAATKVNP